MNAKTSIEVPRPAPGLHAKFGLYRIKSINVEFEDGTPENAEVAALDHLDELINWWRLDWRVWRKARYRPKRGRR